jgi:mono/diheme cytochrome c family protein
MIALALLLAQASVPSPAPIPPPGAAPSGSPSRPATADTPAKSGTPAPTAADASSAKEIYEKRCVFCHAADGTGRTKKGKQLKAPNFTSPRWQLHTTDEEIVKAITDGIPKHKMPAFKDKLTPEQIQSLVPYSRAFAAKK